MGDFQKSTPPPQPMMTEDPWAEDDSRPLADCPYCHGCGFVHPLDSNGAVIKDKVIPCPGAGCLADSIKGFQVSDTFYQSKGMTVVEQTFANFQPRAGTESVLRFAEEFADGKAKWVFLLIYGGVGNGKTHLCNAIAKTVLGRGLDVYLATTTKVLSKLRIAMDDHSTDDLLNKLKDVFVLILDDWGVEYGSEWEKATLEDLLTSRYALAMPTVVTSNLDISQLPPRVRSRFEDKHYSRIVHNAAPDFRNTKRN